MNRQSRAILIQDTIDVGEWRKPCYKNAKRASSRNPPPGTIAADPPKQITPENRTNDHKIDTVKPVYLEKTNKRFYNNRMIAPLQKNQPEHQPSGQTKAEPCCRRALPGNAKIVQRLLHLQSEHELLIVHHPGLPRSSPHQDIY